MTDLMTRGTRRSVMTKQHQQRLAVVRPPMHVHTEPPTSTLPPPPWGSDYSMPTLLAVLQYANIIGGQNDDHDDDEDNDGDDDVDGVSVSVFQFPAWGKYPSHDMSLSKKYANARHGGWVCMFKYIKTRRDLDAHWMFIECSLDVVGCPLDSCWMFFGFSIFTHQEARGLGGFSV